MGFLVFSSLSHLSGAIRSSNPVARREEQDRRHELISALLSATRHRHATWSTLFLLIWETV